MGIAWNCLRMKRLKKLTSACRKSSKKNCHCLIYTEFRCGQSDNKAYRKKVIIISIIAIIVGEIYQNLNERRELWEGDLKDY